MHTLPIDSIMLQCYILHNDLFCSEAELRDFCQLNNTCPENVADSAMDNCCVWHANIHTCHPTVNVCESMDGEHERASGSCVMLSHLYMR